MLACQQFTHTIDMFSRESIQSRNLDSKSISWIISIGTDQQSKNAWILNWIILEITWVIQEIGDSRI
jgi:hypothetical protein